MTVYIFAMIYRQVISLVIGDIKRDLDIDDFRAGLLMGPAFGIFYILGGPIFGILVDRLPRKRVLAAGLPIWSISATACGLASSFLHLFIALMLVRARVRMVAPNSSSTLTHSFSQARLA